MNSGPQEKSSSLPSLSLIIPALNEENLLESTVGMLVQACRKYFSPYELFLFDDGSTDATPVIADELAGRIPELRVVHNRRNRGIGYCYREGIRLAGMEYTGFLPGDAAGILEVKDVERIFAAVGRAGFTLVYPQVDERIAFRRYLSRLFTWGMNVMWNRRVRYYNGPNIYPSRILKTVTIRSDRYAAFSEALVQVQRRGLDYVEVGVPNHDRRGNSKAVRWASVWDVFRTITLLRIRLWLADR